MRKGLAALIAVLVLAGQAEVTTQQDSLLAWMNIARSAGDLRVGWRIDELAQSHSERMAAQRRIFHTADLAAKLDDAGVTYWIYGENVGSSTSGLWALFRAFMASPPHRANILDARFRRVGIGITAAHGALWVTIIFVG